MSNFRQKQEVITEKETLLDEKTQNVAEIAEKYKVLKKEYDEIVSTNLLIENEKDSIQTQLKEYKSNLQEMEGKWKESEKNAKEISLQLDSVLKQNINEEIQNIKQKRLGNPETKEGDKHADPAPAALKRNDEKSKENNVDS